MDIILRDWVVGISSIFGVFGALGAASAYWGQNRAKNVIALQKEELEVVNEINARLTNEAHANAIERAALVEKTKSMQQQIDDMRTLVTAAPQIAKLSEDVITQHKQIVQSLQDIVKLLTEGNNK